MPGVLMALGRLNRPGLMVYGGTIRPGACSSMEGTLDIVSAFQSYGKYLSEGGTADAEKRRYDTIRHACPGPGACGGMYSEYEGLSPCVLRSAQLLTQSGRFAPRNSGQHDRVLR